jgi:uncharacterized RDD family membrane protein YckC
MSIWDILEIEATSDTKVIKRAYAKKLKVTRPDEDPKGFQELHWAYKTALQHAEWMARREAAGDDEEDYDDYEDESSEESNSNSEVSELDISNLDLQLQNTTDPLAEEKSISESIAELRNQLVNPPETSSDTLINQQESIDQTINHNINQTTDHITNQTIETSEYSVAQEQITETVANPYQIEGERLLGIAQLLLGSNGEQAKANSWSFILESSFILEDHFNWRLGLEMLRLIREHNLESAAQVNKIVGQEALTYLDSIFNWKDNYHQVIRVMGDEYKTWLDMIREPESKDTNWQDKIRGGKKIVLATQTNHTTQEQSQNSIIAPPFKRFMAWFIDWVFLILVITLLKKDSPDLSPFVPSIIFPLLYFVFFESSQLQGTIGKRILGLKVVKSDLKPMGILDCILRTICFMIYQVVILAAIVGISMSIPFAAFIIVGAYAYSFSKDPTLFYDRITNTRVVKTR